MQNTLLGYALIFLWVKFMGLVGMCNYVSYRVNVLAYGILLSGGSGENPWSILGDPVTNSVYAGSLTNLAFVLRKGGIVLCFLAIACSVVKLLVYHDQKSQTELKNNIIHKLWVIILIASLVTLFTLLKTTADQVFGL